MASTKITQNVYLGSAEDLKNEIENFSCIINLAKEIAYESIAPQYHFKLLDGFPIDQEIIKKCMEILFFCEERNWKVLVHCVGGVSRSASIIICYVALKNHWSFRDAFIFVETLRPQIDPDWKVCKSVMEYLNNAKN